MAQACLLLSQATPEWSGGIQWNWRNIYLPLSQKMFVLMSTWFLSSWRKRQSGSMAPNYSVTFGNASDRGTLQAPLFGLVCHQMWEGTTPCGQLIILTELKQVAVTSCTSPNSYLLHFFSLPHLLVSVFFKWWYLYFLLWFPIQHHQCYTLYFLFIVFLCLTTRTLPHNGNVDLK